MSRTIRTLLVLLVVALLVLLGATVGYFLVQNADWVVVRFPTAQFDWDHPFPTVEYESPLALVMVASMLVGFIISVVLFAPSWIRRAWERRREKRFINSLEGELTELRNQPVDRPAPLEDLPEVPVHDKARGGVQEEDEDAALLAAALRETDQERGR